MNLRKIIALGLQAFFGAYAWVHWDHDNATWALVLMFATFLMPLDRLRFDQVIEATRTYKGREV